MKGHTITRESGRNLAGLLRKERYQPPLERDTNTRPVGGGGPRRKFFKLVEDANGEYGPAWARVTNRTGSVDGKLFQLYWWDSLIDGAKPGYKGTWEWLDSEQILESGKCPDYCFSSGSFGADSLDDGTVGSPYSDDLLPSGTTPSAVTGMDLPPGLAVDGNGIVSGTPTQAGTFYPIFSTTADKTGPAPVTAGEKCTITKLLPITITEAE